MKKEAVRHKMQKIFVSDYDGTITDKDFYSLLAERYAPADTPDYFAQYREGRISHFEAMAAYFAFAPTEEQQLEELLAASQVDPDLSASATLLRRAGWELWVVSAGSSWYVERVLRRAGVAATVYSNPGHLENGRGLVLEKLDSSSPYHSASVGVDKSAVVQHALHIADTVAFAGDGPPDWPCSFGRGCVSLAGSWPSSCGSVARLFNRSRAGVRLRENWHEKCANECALPCAYQARSTAASGPIPGALLPGTRRTASQRRAVAVDPRRGSSEPSGSRHRYDSGP